MDREQAKSLWPIIKAYAEGKQIEIKTKVEGSYWDILEEDDMQYIDFKKCDLRIKPEPKYRPFASAKECFEEMQKHHPIGWTKLIGENEYSLITDVNDNISYSDAMKEYTFADGEPFGIIEDYI